MRTFLKKILICLYVVVIIVSCSQKPPKTEWIKVGEDPLGEVFYDRNSVVWHPITPTYGVYSVWVMRTYITEAINELQTEGPGMSYSLIKYRFDCVLRKYTKVHLNTWMRKINHVMIHDCQGKTCHHSHLRKYLRTLLIRHWVLGKHHLIIFERP